MMASIVNLRKPSNEEKNYARAYIKSSQIKMALTALYLVIVVSSFIIPISIGLALDKEWTYFFIILAIPIPIIPLIIWFLMPLGIKISFSEVLRLTGPREMEMTGRKTGFKIGKVKITPPIPWRNERVWYERETEALTLGIQLSGAGTSLLGGRDQLLVFEMDDGCNALNEPLPFPVMPYILALSGFILMMCLIPLMLVINYYPGWEYPSFNPEQTELTVISHLPELSDINENIILKSDNIGILADDHNKYWLYETASHTMQAFQKVREQILEMHRLDKSGVNADKRETVEKEGVLQSRKITWLDKANELLREYYSGLTMDKMYGVKNGPYVNEHIIDEDKFDEKIELEKELDLIDNELKKSAGFRGIYVKEEKCFYFISEDVQKSILHYNFIFGLYRLIFLPILILYILSVIYSLTRRGASGHFIVEYLKEKYKDLMDHFSSAR
jgi:hypothetical protein